MRSESSPRRCPVRVVAAATVALALLVPALSAGAQSGVGVGPNPVVVSADQGTAVVEVSWSGLVPGQLVFVDICWRSVTDPAFSVSADCGQYSGVTPNGTADGAGGTMFEVFRGQDPAGESWGCYAPGDTPPAGVTKHTTCFIRVTDTVVLNLDNDSEVPFTFEGSDRVDPGSGAGGGDPVAAPTLPAGTGVGMVPAPVVAPTGDPAPGESLQVAGAVGVAGVSITG